MFKGIHLTNRVCQNISKCSPPIAVISHFLCLYLSFFFTCNISKPFTTAGTGGSANRQSFPDSAHDLPQSVQCHIICINIFPFKLFRKVYLPLRINMSRIYIFLYPRRRTFSIILPNRSLLPEPTKFYRQRTQLAAIRPKSHYRYLSFSSSSIFK